MKKGSILVTCPECEGSGRFEVERAPSFAPMGEEGGEVWISERCWMCEGSGEVDAETWRPYDHRKEL